jgi:ribosome assembly protein 1
LHVGTLEHVNAVIGSFFAEQLIVDGEDDPLTHVVDNDEVAEEEPDEGRRQEGGEEGEEEEDEDLYYAPEKGNVVFASAWDGWAFR